MIGEDLACAALWFRKFGLHAFGAVAILFFYWAGTVYTATSPEVCPPATVIDEIIRAERPKMGAREKLFWREAVMDAAVKRGADPVVIASQVAQESHFHGRRVSTAGATGALQVMPFWLQTSTCKGTDLMEIEAALECGAGVYAKYVKETGAVEKALQRYAAGATNENGSQAKAYRNEVLARVYLATAAVCKAQEPK